MISSYFKRRTAVFIFPEITDGTQYYEFKKLTTPHTITRRILRIPPNIRIMEHKRKTQSVREDLKMIEKISEIIDIPERETIPDYLMIFKYNCIETLKEYFKELKGHDPSLFDYMERMIKCSDYKHLSGVLIGTKELSEYVEFHSYAPKFHEIKYISMNKTETYENMYVIIITTDKQILCVDVYQNFKFIKHDIDMGESILAYYDYPFTMRNSREDVEREVHNNEIYLQILDVNDCDKFPIRLSDVIHSLNIKDMNVHLFI
jgi:hypothetical protein